MICASVHFHLALLQSASLVWLIPGVPLRSTPGCGPLAPSALASNSVKCFGVNTS